MSSNCVAVGRLQRLTNRSSHLNVVVTVQHRVRNQIIRHYGYHGVHSF